jgi:subtilisin-like proprotein convertase family protein
VVLISPKGTEETVSGTSGTFTMTSFKDEDAKGTWTLEIEDGRKKKTGTLVAWSLRIGVETG